MIALSRNQLKMPENEYVELDVFGLAPYNDKKEGFGGQKACMA